MISQYTKDRPNPRVDAWLATINDRELYLSTITLAELALGAEQLPSGKRRRALESWLREDLLLQFRERTLSVDTDVAMHFGRIVGMATRAGFTVGAMDGLIAAVAAANGMVLATLNRKDFEPLGVELVTF